MLFGHDAVCRQNPQTVRFLEVYAGEVLEQNLLHASARLLDTPVGAKQALEYQQHVSQADLTTWVKFSWKCVRLVAACMLGSSYGQAISDDTPFQGIHQTYTLHWK